MKKKHLWLILPFSGLLIHGCSKEPESVVQPEEIRIEKKADNLSRANIYVDEELAKILESSSSEGSPVTKSEAVNNIFGSLGVTRFERLFPDTGRFEERRRESGLHRWYRIVYDSSIAATKAEEAISQIDGVTVFEKDWPIKINDDLPFDDPRLTSQWQYYNNGTGSSWKEKVDINVFPVWKNYSTGSSDVIVGVVDGGIDVSHEDLQGVVNTSGSWNFCSKVSKITATNHGTHVGGTIGAINNNGKGVSGIAGGDAKAGIKGVRLLSCQIFSDDSEGSGDGASAIVWAADHGAVICNNSWGYDFEKDDGSWDTKEAKEMHEFYEQPNQGEYKSGLKDAIDYFNKYAGLDESGNQEGPMAGGIVFFSAGNEASEYGAPACYPGAIAVGAYGPGGTRAYYSNFGTKEDNWVDIAAPGGDYHSTQILSTLPGNAYGYYQGTSMACPHASGVAALLVSALGSPGFTRDMLVERLLKASNPNLNITNSRIGIPIDAMGALSRGSDPEIPAAVTTLNASTSSNTITATWKITGSKNGVSAYAYRLFYGTDKNSVAAATAKNPGTGVSSITVETGMGGIGESLSASFEGDFETTYYLKVLGYDYGLNYSENSNIASVKTPANQAPVIKPSIDVSNIILKATANTSISFEISDPDGHTFEVSHKAGSAAENLMDISGKYILTIDAPKAEAGKYICEITATDAYGLATTLQVKYTIRENNSPKVIAQISNILFSNLSETRKLPMLEYFNDPDDDELTFTFQTSSPSVAHITSGTENNAFITSMDYGLTEMTIIASDARKATAVQTFRVLVREAGVEVQAYPTTVTDNIYIATGETRQPTDIKIVSQTGYIFFDKTIECSAFEPAGIDMTNAAPGKYVVIMTFSGKEYRQSIVKK